jgi:hypothetical protein
MDEAAAQFIKIAIAEGKVPSSVEVTDAKTGKTYVVAVQLKGQLFETRYSTKASIPGSGERCGCCRGTGRG